MGENTKIEWCDHTFNPWRGCTKVAAGCANCYAESQAKRNTGTLGIWGPNGTRVVAAESAWKQVEKWDRFAINLKDAADGVEAITGERIEYFPPSVFCGSMCDVFEDWPGEIRDSRGKIVHQCRAGHSVSLDAVYAYGAECESGCNRAVHPLTMSDVRARVFNLIDATRLTWLLLTKRPENIRPMWHWRDCGDNPGLCENWQRKRRNVWLGTSIACQEDAERSIPELLKCRDLCAGLFLSIEPLIGPVDLHRWLYVGEEGGWEYVGSRSHLIDQVIIGGESGPHARPCNIDWIRSITRQCEAAGVLCMVKQIGSNPVGLRFSIDDNGRPFCIENDSFRGGAKPLDKKGGDPAEWPEDLRQYRKLAWKGGA